MSASNDHLGLELILLWDELSHAIQQMLNCHNVHCSKNAPKNAPSIVTQEFNLDTDIRADVTPDAQDSYPYMAASEQYYTRNIRHKYTEAEEEQRK